MKSLIKPLLLASCTLSFVATAAAQMAQPTPFGVLRPNSITIEQQGWGGGGRFDLSTATGSSIVAGTLTAKEQELQGAQLSPNIAESLKTKNNIIYFDGPSKLYLVDNIEYCLGPASGNMELMQLCVTDLIKAQEGAEDKATGIRIHYTKPNNNKLAMNIISVEPIQKRSSLHQ